MTYAILNRMLNVEFRLLYILTAIILMIFAPGLQATVIFYLVSYISLEFYQKGIQDTRARLITALPVFFLSSIISGLIFSLFSGYFGANPVYMGYSLPIVVMLSFCVAGFEEGIYRNILPKILGGPVISNIFYSLLHFVTGKVVLGFFGTQLVSYLIFSFLFGFLMTMFSHPGGSSKGVGQVISVAMHFTFLLANYGVQTMFFGGVF